MSDTIVDLPSDMSLPAIGRFVTAWRLYNFGVQSPLRHSCQISEEAGEVARVVGKSDEGIRAATRGDLGEELADVIMAALGFATSEKIDIEVALLKKMKKMQTLDFTKNPEGKAETTVEVVEP